MHPQLKGFVYLNLCWDSLDDTLATVGINDHSNGRFELPHLLKECNGKRPRTHWVRDNLMGFQELDSRYTQTACKHIPLVAGFGHGAVRGGVKVLRECSGGGGKD